ncbi:hypothetical protein ACJX0J_028746, partial [Zea mays]
LLHIYSLAKRTYEFSTSPIAFCDLRLNHSCSWAKRRLNKSDRRILGARKKKIMKRKPPNFTPRMWLVDEIAGAKARKHLNEVNSILFYMTFIVLFLSLVQMMMMMLKVTDMIESRNS